LILAYKAIQNLLICETSGMMFSLRLTGVLGKSFRFLPVIANPDMGEAISARARGLLRRRSAPPRNDEG